MTSKMTLLLMTGVWLGLLIGLSFIEAPLKFKAPGITIELGLGIGRLVFGVLNKIEISFALILLLQGLFLFKNIGTTLVITMGILILIVLIQTFYLLPILDERAELILSREVVVDSGHHLWYIVLEVIKLPTLLVLFFKGYQL